MDQMGSPYLLAHGLGTPVKDAVTLARFPMMAAILIWWWSAVVSPEHRQLCRQLATD
jgi:hypothetical protein